MWIRSNDMPIRANVVVNNEDYGTNQPIPVLAQSQLFEEIEIAEIFPVRLDGEPGLNLFLLNGWECPAWFTVELLDEDGIPIGQISRELFSYSGMSFRLVAERLTDKIKAAGVEDIVLDPGVRDLKSSLALNTLIRRLALKKTFRALGFPIITFPAECADDEGMISIAATQAITKYGGFVVLDKFSPATIYPLLALRTNIYTDPQQPIQVQPGVYEINDPQQDSPVMVTTNFSITYFSVANEVDGSGSPGWLLVADAEGMSVLTAWAAGHFDAERIAKSLKSTGVEEKISHKKLIIPGHVAVLLGELEEELPGWEIMVGPRESVDLPGFLKLWSP